MNIKLANKLLFHINITICESPFIYRHIFNMHANTYHSSWLVAIRERSNDVVHNRTGS